ncbi:sporulation protein YunB [Thalassobacillus sp. C254]|uniref:sporulation protein YunB n=1 Tax=Thalassobacillus sp. C254 TaxID=1225341 RepID=UPI0006D25061|nr:sporulation protein YunB [Thalassobacillus sp. C254]
MGKNRRWKRQKGPLPFRYVFLLSSIIFIALTIQGLWLVDQGIRPTLIAIAKTETQKIATQAINDAISKKIVENIDMEELMVIEKDNQGNITSVGFNPQVSNRVLSEATLRVQKYLKMVEEGKIEDLGLPDGIEMEFDKETFTENGIIHMIPLGQATNNALLAHLGPKVPVRFTAIGDVKATMTESIYESGINNTYIRVSLDLEVDVKVVIPFATDDAVVPTSIPIGMVFVSGQVPDFYNHGQGDMPAPAIIQEKDLEDIIHPSEENEEEVLEVPDQEMEIVPD